MTSLKYINLHSISETNRPNGSDWYGPCAICLLFFCVSSETNQEAVKYTKKILKNGDKTTFPQKGDIVECYYSGKLDNGKVFDTNMEGEWSYGDHFNLRPLVFSFFRVRLPH